MSIKVKLFVILGLVSLVLGIAVWHELTSAYRVEKQVQLFVPATGYLLGIAEVNTGIARQAKEALDYMVTGEQQDRDQFNRLTKDVERGFELWIKSAETQSRLGVEGELEDIGEGQEIRDVYYRWVGHIIGSFELIDQGHRTLALRQFEKSSWSLLEKRIFVAIDSEMRDGFKEVENAYHELLIATGGRLWGQSQDSKMLVSLHAAIDNVIAGCRVNSAVGRQFSALSTYLLTGNRKSFERYEELKIEVRGAIDEWFFAANDRPISADPYMSNSVVSVSKVVSSLEELLELEEQAIDINQTGGSRRALQMIINGPMESPIGEHLPLMVFSALDLGSKELVALAAKTSHQGVILIGVAFLCVLLMILHMGRNLLFSLRVLQDGMDAVSAGNLQQEIELNGRDELAQLADNFNRMSSSLYQSRVEVDGLNRCLEQRVADRTKELARANRELEAFNSAVSHDLRTPLSTVIGYSELMLENEQTGEEFRSESAQAILSAGEKMESIIGTLLDLSRIDTLELSLTKVDMSTLAKDVTNRLQSQEPGRQAAVVIEHHLSVDADCDLLMIVLENLLGNAWKYTAGQPQPEIELGSDYNGNQCVYFVRDNGAGFDMAEADKLFMPFQRLHTQDEFEGIGIGLATVQRIIQCHGGEIWAESEVGAGATFYFTLGR